MQQILERLEWDRAGQLLTASGCTLVVGHARPDGDCIGSIAAVGMLAQSLGKQAVMAVDGGVPNQLGFVPSSDAIRPDLDTDLSAVDLVISVDSSDQQNLGQVGGKAFSLPVPKVVIDHHATNTLFGDVHIVSSNAVSTTELVYDWLQHLQVPIAAPLAKSLLVGILTDTQLLRVGTITGALLAKLAHLVGTGVDFQALRRAIQDAVPLDMLHLYGTALGRATIAGGVAWTYLTREDFHANNLPAVNTSRAVDQLIRLEGAVVAAEFAETDEGCVRLSLRADDGYDVGQIAVQLGGGGHVKSGGCTLYHATVAPAIEQVLPLLLEEAQRH